MAKWLIILISILMLSGCATVGKPIEQDKLASIKEGQTTKQEVINLLGKPYMITMSSDGKEMLMYQYVKSQIRASTMVPIVGLFVGGADTKQQILQVLIDKDGKVEKYIFNDSDTPINSGLLNTSSK